MNNQQKLDLLKEKVCDCSKCPELVASRRQHVFGEGDPNAQLVFCGEAPGRTEDETGRPFVGRSGKLLDVMLENIGLKREQVFILNTVKCHPDNNRAPLPEESANCRPFLDLQLKILDPKIVVCLGGVAAKNLLKTQQSLSNMRNRWYSLDKAKVRVTFHPAYLLRNPAAKADAWEDFKAIREALG